ncbi:MAG: hypothetical protein NVSMB58_37840 [Terriglobales bacterium]
MNFDTSVNKKHVRSPNSADQLASFFSLSSNVGGSPTHRKVEDPLRFTSPSVRNYDGDENITSGMPI